MQTYIPKEQWMLVPREERLVLAEDFKLAKTGITEVHDNAVVSDGYSTDDLRVINAESMAEYTGSSTEESFLRLWDLTVAKARSVVNPPIGTLQNKDDIEILDTTVVDDGGDISVVDTSNDVIIEPVTETEHAPAKKARTAKK